MNGSAALASTVCIVRPGAHVLLGVAVSFVVLLLSAGRADAATEIIRYVNTASTGGDGTTNGTSGASAAYATCTAMEAAEQTARANLVSRDEQLTVYFSGTSADTAPCEIDGFTTDSTRFIKLVGNNTTGNWNTSAYRIFAGTGTANYRSFIIKDDYTQVYDFQIEKQNQAGTMSDRWVAVRVSNISAGVVLLDRLIVKGSLTAQSDSKTAVHCEVSAGECRITNAIVYDWTHSGSPTNVQAFESTGSGQMSVYNATIQNAAKGVTCNGTLRIRNTIFQDVTTETSGTCDTANSSNNLTDLSTDLPGSSDVTSATLTFLDKAGDDFHLDSGDSSAIGAGVALDSLFTSDIDGAGNRGVSGWDIGADEQSGGGGTTTTTTTTSSTTTTVPAGTVTLLDIDMDATAGCSTGYESACFVANGFDSGDAADAPGCRIITGSSSRAAQGSGYMKCVGTPNGTGPGSTQVSFTGYKHVRMRFYSKFGPGFLTYGVGGHGPGIQGHGDTACSEPGTIEMRQAWPYAYNSGSCAPSHDAYPTDAGLPELKNNHWYRWEIYVAADTNGSDGIQKLWIDGTQYIDETDVNWGGLSKNILFDAIWAARNYYHARWPDWEPAIYFDGFKVVGHASVDPGTIGAASDENADLGTADTTGPEFTAVSAEAWAGKHFAGDCSTPSSYLNTSVGYEYRAGDNGDASLDATHTNNHFDFSDGCTGTNRALKIAITGGAGGAGVYWEVPSVTYYGHYFPDWVINTYVYLPSANDYTTKPPLFGFAGYSGAPGSYGDYVAFTIGTDAKPAVVQRDYSISATQTTVSTAASAITLDAWHKVEIQIHENQKIDVYVDGSKVIDNVTLTYNPDWIFGAMSSPKIVAGVINYTDTEDFNMWMDDTRIGTVSFDTCDNWDAASCPEALGGAAQGEEGGVRCEDCACSGVIQ